MKAPFLAFIQALTCTKIKYESKRLEISWHYYDSFNFLVTAWHLYSDWKSSDDSQAISRKKREYKNLPNSMRMVLDTVRDLVNGSKHFQLTPKSAGKRRVEAVHDGKEVGWYQFLFRERTHGVTVDGTWYFSIRLLNNFIMRYFEWVFDDSVSVDTFPKDLNEAILYCNIASRTGKTAPALYLKSIEKTRHKKPHET